MKIKMLTFIMIFLVSSLLQACVWDAPKDFQENDSSNLVESENNLDESENNAVNNEYQKINVIAEGTQSTNCWLYFPTQSYFFATAEVIEVNYDEKATNTKLKLLSIDTTSDFYDADYYKIGDIITIREPFYLIGEKNPTTAVIINRSPHVMGTFLPMLEGKKYFIAFVPADPYEITIYYALPMFNFLAEDGYQNFNFVYPDEKPPKQEFRTIEDIDHITNQEESISEYYVLVNNMLESYKVLEKYYDSDETNAIFDSVEDWINTKQD